jgi:hypothetical protein
MSDDPMDTPLPCDVQINRITFKKGVSLRTLVEAAARWQADAASAFIEKHNIDPKAFHDFLGKVTYK